MYLKSFLTFTVMKIIVGSTNQVKVEIVKEIVKEYPQLAPAEVIGVNAESGVSNQPLSLEEIMNGAINRARAAYQSSECNYGVGIESGLHQVPKAGYMESTSCVFYDGNKIYPGLSAAFPCPEEVITLILSQGLNLSQASYQAGLTRNQELGKAEGIVGVLTKNRITRRDYTAQAIHFAIIGIEWGSGKELK